MISVRSVGMGRAQCGRVSISVYIQHHPRSYYCKLSCSNQGRTNTKDVIIKIPLPLLRWKRENRDFKGRRKPSRRMRGSLDTNLYQGAPYLQILMIFVPLESPVSLLAKNGKDRRKCSITSRHPTLLCRQCLLKSSGLPSRFPLPSRKSYKLRFL